MYILLLIFSSVNPYLQFKDLEVTLPPIGDNLLNFILTNDNTVYYKLPKVYQANNTGGLSGVFSAEYLPEINANLDFPWDAPFGFNQVPKEVLETYNFFLLPKGKKIVIFREIPVKWIHPNMGIFGEILIVKDKSKNRKYICEIRIRIKRLFGAIADWETKIFRQVGNRMELESYLGVPTYYSNSMKPTSKYLKLENPEKDKVFVAQSYVDVLPDLPHDKVETIFTTFPFKEVTNDTWSENCIAPTSNQEFNIFPKNYALLLKMDSFACQKCHRQTFVPNNRLLPNEPIIKENSSKIGRIRGYDGIFTWHPFDESAISKDGESKGFKLRDYDFNHGYVEYYDPAKHKDYILTTFVQKELIEDEMPSPFRTKPTALNVEPADQFGIKVSLANPEFVKYYRPQWNGGLYIDYVSPDSILANSLSKGEVMTGVSIGKTSYATLQYKDLEDISRLPNFKNSQLAVWVITPEGAIIKRLFSLVK